MNMYFARTTVILVVFITAITSCKPKVEEDLNTELPPLNGTDVPDSVLVSALTATVNEIVHPPIIAGANSNPIEAGATACRIPKPGFKDLENLRTVVKILDGSKEAGASVMGFAGLKLGKSEKNVNVFYVETVVEDCDGVEKVYGIGYSLHLLVKKLSRKISLNDIPKISASCTLEQNKTEVYYCIQSYGITGYPLKRFFKPVVNEPFDIKGYGIMQSCIDGLHGVVSDSTLSKFIKYTPRELPFLTAADVKNP